MDKPYTFQVRVVGGPLESDDFAMDENVWYHAHYIDVAPESYPYFEAEVRARLVAEQLLSTLSEYAEANDKKVTPEYRIIIMEAINDEPKTAEGLVHLTDLAAEKVVVLMAEGQESEELPEGPLILRVAVVGGGCSGFSYKMGFQSKDEIDGDDVVCEEKGVTVVVNSQFTDYIEGTTIDFEDGLMGAGFSFENPKSTGSCGCGESFGV